MIAAVAVRGLWELLADHRAQALTMCAFLAGNQSELEFRMKKKMKMFKVMDVSAHVSQRCAL